MSDDGEVEGLREDQPDLAEPLESVTTVDADRDTWSFEDIPVESDPFCELVASGVVEKVDEECRIADPEAVRSAFAAQDAGGGSADTNSPPTGSDATVESLFVPSFEDRAIDALTSGNRRYRA